MHYFIVGAEKLQPDLEREFKERCGVKEVFIGYTGAVIGSHSGPGTLALFFLGNKR